MRKLVTIRQISAIDPIPGADAIEVATVDGWKVVVKKGEFVLGQHVVYFEIDSILPEGRPEFDFLMARGCKDQTTDQPGVTLRGHRLRTIKLRGQVSQGLIIPLPDELTVVKPDYSDTMYILWVPHAEASPSSFDFDADLSDVFGVMKYEKPIPASLAGQVRGNYPSWMPKTDQERVQNCFKEIPQGVVWDIEEKVEGSSITIYWDGENVGVTSRNLDLKLDQEGNTFVDTAKRSGLLEYVKRLGEVKNTRVAIRGELVGPGIQDNIYQLKDFRIYIYDVWMGDRYLTPNERENLLSSDEYSDFDIDVAHFVPLVYSDTEISAMTLDEILAFADGQSMINNGTLREGLVFKSHTTPVFSFKAISNKYLLKEK